MKELDEMQREWFRTLLEAAIENERTAVDNEMTWGTGSPHWETGFMHRKNAGVHSDYIRFLEELKARYCGTT